MYLCLTKIYTKKGDTGMTSLIGGTRVSKHHIRVEAYGTVDELNVYVGLLGAQQIQKHAKDVMKAIQDRLFTIGASLASDPTKSKMSIPDLREDDVTLLEQEIDAMESVLEPLKNFILPGGNTVISFCHIARVVCRRAERIVSALAETDKVEPLVIKYLNRLSDYFFVLARRIAKDDGISETEWRGRDAS